MMPSIRWISSDEKSRSLEEDNAKMQKVVTVAMEFMVDYCKGCCYLSAKRPCYTRDLHRDKCCKLIQALMGVLAC
jgi:hypothetical protein